jgi:8-oxo-dGTP pyrophosphatase MutT (NUDIX family)
VEHKDGRYLFIYRNDKWDLPKGKIEKKEIILNAAVREVSEETGVADLIVSKPLPTTYHIYNANGKFKLKLTHWFLMKTKYTLPLKPQIEENIQKAEWINKEEISGLLDNAYENIKIVVGTALK